MNKMPPKLRKELSEDPYYSYCARADDHCDGRITWEHAFTYGGKQIQQAWAIVPLCEYHHAVNRHQDGGSLNKEFNRLLCYRRSRVSELRRDFPKAVDGWMRDWDYLEDKYGHPCTDPELEIDCTGCTDTHSEGTHQGCTKQHGHVGCDISKHETQS